MAWSINGRVRILFYGILTTVFVVSSLIAWGYNTMTRVPIDEVRRTIQTVSIAQLQNPDFVKSLASLRGNETILEQLVDPRESQAIRRNSAFALLGLGIVPTAARRVFKESLRDSSPLVRALAANALGKLENVDGSEIDALLPLLEDSSELVVCSVALTLGRVGRQKPGVVRALLDSLPVAKGDEVGAIARALGLVGDGSPAVVRGLIDLVGRQDPTISVPAVEALAAQGQNSSKALPTLLKALQSSDPHTQRAAAEALASFPGGATKTTQALLTAASKESGYDSLVRRAAVDALGRRGNRQPNVIRGLCNLLTDSDPWVRRAAIEALRRLRSDHPSVPAGIVRAMDDKDGVVRREAVRAVKQLSITDPEALRSVMKLVQQDPEVDVRCHALLAIGQFGATSPDVIETLVRSYKSLHDAIHSQNGGDEAAAWQRKTEEVYSVRVALTQLGLPAVKCMVNLLEQSQTDQTLRQALIRALHIFEGDHPAMRTAAPALAQQLAQPDRTASQAISLLTQFKDAAIPALREALSIADENFRERVVFTLGQIAPDADQAEKDLEALSQAKCGLYLHEPLGENVLADEIARTLRLVRKVTNNSRLEKIYNKPYNSKLISERVNKLMNQGGVLPSPEEIKNLFADLPRPSNARREAVVSLLEDVTKEGVAQLKSANLRSDSGKVDSITHVLLTAVPEDYTESISLLGDISRHASTEAVISLLSALDAYLVSHEPHENSRIRDPIARRRDLVRQKRELAEEVCGVFEQLDIKLCCPSGLPGSVKVIDNAPNTKGQFRLLPRGSGCPEVGRARFRDLIPFLRFEGLDVHFQGPPILPAKTDFGRNA